MAEPAATRNLTCPVGNSLAGSSSVALARFGISTTMLVPLTAGNNRLGAFGFSSVAPFDPSPAEWRSWSESPASSPSRSSPSSPSRKQSGSGTGCERCSTSRMRWCRSCRQTSCSLPYPAQLSKVIPHDFSVLTLRDETGGLEMVALHFTGAPLFEKEQGRINPEGMPTAEALATGKPVVVRDTDLARYTSPQYRRFVELGCKSACSVPLITSKGTLGTLEIARTTSDVWTDDDVEFLVQVADTDCHRRRECTLLSRTRRR